MFIIECMNGKIIQKYSHFPDENEVVLLPCSYFEVLDKIDQGNGLRTIHIKQIQPPVLLIQPPFSTSPLPVETANTVPCRGSSTNTDPNATWNNNQTKSKAEINKNNLDKADGHSEIRFELKSSYDKLVLVGRYWPVPNVNKPNAVVLFVHGSGEHCQRYRHVAHFFNKHQIPCVAYDLRGNGLSGGQRGFIPNMDALLDDLECVIKYIRKDLDFTMPLVIYAHGTGCVNCLAHILQRQKSRPDCQAMILSTPSICLKERPTPLAFFASRVVSSLIPRLPLLISGNYTNEYTDDKEIVEAYRNDLLVHDKWPAQTISLLLEFGKLLETTVVQFPVPVMIQHGVDDNITPIKMIQKWAQERVKGDDVMFKSWPGHRHEIHNDMGREDVFNYVLEWIEKRLKIEQH
ncbi:unnamed protein product [Rotaria sordida]|uniref:Serine aminopeptidase S33 domain-containing protein n=1 Tax=Rotaria sordida TaxID=392033 RepID=A0A814ZBJ4_9BILA|nr:unnamed protein product [Rotaria sordida]CAF1522598.1 unnamed protein product [Rotaria sordida]